MGVGAAIAPGSQKWNGTSADLLSAPTSISSAPTVARVPVGGSANSSWRDSVPDVCQSATMPTSIARPPVVVTIRAVCAAPRLARRVGSWAIRR